MALEPLKMGGLGHFKTSKKKPNFGGNTHVTLNPKPKQLNGLHYQNFQILWNTEKVNQRLESQTPPYFPNGDSVREFFYIIGFRILENGGLGHL